MSGRVTAIAGFRVVESDLGDPARPWVLQMSRGANQFGRELWRGVDRFETEAEARAAIPASRGSS